MVPSLDPHIICLGTLYFVDWGLQSTRSQLIFSTTERSNLRQVTVGTFWLPLCHLENKNFQKKNTSTMICYDSDTNASKSLWRCFHQPPFFNVASEAERTGALYSASWCDSKQGPEHVNRYCKPPMTDRNLKGNGIKKNL